MSTRMSRSPVVIAVAALALAGYASHSALGQDRESPITERAFRAQILLNSDVQVITSPGSGEGSEWASWPYWNSNHKASTVLVLVRITPPLLDAAVAHWHRGLAKADDRRMQDARARLQKRFAREDEYAFLLVVRPIVAAKYHDEWGIKIGPVAQNIKLVTLDGSTGDVVRSEQMLDDFIEGDSPVRSCLFWLQDKVDEQSDPSFNIKLSNVYYSIEKDRSGHPRKWITAKSPETVYFRFETGDVPVLAMLENGIPWEHIEATYLQPRLRIAEAASSDEAAKFLLEVAVDLIVGLLLRGL